MEQPGEYQSLGSPEGTLRYLAPEQTGHIGRAVDHRSDLYSLGSTLYHLVCGQPPFVSNDYAELVHAHIARTPQAACLRNPAVPASVSRVLDKLLAKAPEDRYQSAASVGSDLQHCLALWQAGQDAPDFVPGRNDHPTRLTLPQRLYGFDAELAQLQTAIDAAAAGHAQRVLISGAAGAGKSFLVNTCRGAVEQHRGWLCRASLICRSTSSRMRPFARCAGNWCCWRWPTSRSACSSCATSCRRSWASQAHESAAGFARAATPAGCGEHGVSRAICRFPKPGSPGLSDLGQAAAATAPPAGAVY